MRKYTIIIALFVITTLMACGSGSTTNEVTDSTAVEVDSNAVTGNDTTVAKITTDSTESKPETTK